MSFLDPSWEGMVNYKILFLAIYIYYQLKCLNFLPCSSNGAKESIFYSYTRHINGFAAILEEEVAAEIAS